MSIRTGVHQGVATIEIARPEKKNALTVAMYAAMAEALHAAQADAAVRAVLITGQPGLVFTSGNDIDDFMNRPPSGGIDSPTSPVVLLHERRCGGCEKPVVAGVTGAAIGIGTTMLLHCDLVYAVRRSAPGDALREPRPRARVRRRACSCRACLGHVRAAEKLLLGDPFTGADAVEFGIANAVLPARRGAEPCAAHRRAFPTRRSQLRWCARPRS